VMIWVHGNTMVLQSAGFTLKQTLAARQEYVLLIRRVILQLKGFMNLGELTTRIHKIRMFAKFSPKYTVCILIPR
jgi:hypothetical protein